MLKDTRTAYRLRRWQRAHNRRWHKNHDKNIAYRYGHSWHAESDSRKGEWGDKQARRHNLAGEGVVDNRRHYDPNEVLVDEASELDYLDGRDYYENGEFRYEAQAWNHFSGDIDAIEAYYDHQEEYSWIWDYELAEWDREEKELTAPCNKLIYSSTLQCEVQIIPGKDGLCDADGNVIYPYPENIWADEVTNAAQTRYEVMFLRHLEEQQWEEPEEPFGAPWNVNQSDLYDEDR